MQTKTESTCRGIPVFMAPEIKLEDLKLAGKEDLEKADIWSLGLMTLSMINSNLSDPYIVLNLNGPESHSLSRF